VPTGTQVLDWTVPPEWNTLEMVVAVVTGASSGVGRAVALALAERRARLWLVGRDEERLEEAAEEARSRGAEVEAHRADLTVDEDIQGLAQRVEREAGRVDVLVHSAAVIQVGETVSASVEDSISNTARTCGSRSR
jgi:short-subunit dehydrogenase